MTTIDPPHGPVPFVVAFDPTMLDLLTDWTSHLGLELADLGPDPDTGMDTYACVIPAGHPLHGKGTLDGYVARRQRDVEEERKQRLAARIEQGRRTL